MKKYLATRLRRLANFLDPPQTVSLGPMYGCVTHSQMQKALGKAFDKFKREAAMSRERRG
jgi:hypothetical protein